MRRKLPVIAPAPSPRAASIPADPLAAALCAITDPSRVHARLIDRVARAADASFYSLVPRVVVEPASIDEVRAVFALGRERRVPVTLRAAGTSLSGQAITDGILVDVSRGFRALTIEADGARARFEPGVIGARVNAALRSRERRIGPDPASIDSAMMGGILANNASGMCCRLADNAYSTLTGVRYVLPSGAVVGWGDVPDARPLAEVDPALAAGIDALRRQVIESPALVARIRAKYRIKNTTGYALNAFLDFEDPGAVLAHLLIGSEGTLAFIAEASLSTLPDLPHKRAALLVFDHLDQACASIEAIAGAGARAIELLDRASLRSVEGKAPSVPRGLPDDAAALLVELQEASAEEIARAEARAGEVKARLPLGRATAFTGDPAERAALWTIRKGLFPSVGAMRRAGTTVIIEDVAFPRVRLAPAVSDLRRLFDDHGYDEAIVFGHAREGNVHFVITQAFDDDAEVRRYQRFMADLARLVLDRHDGSMKAEHGTGRNVAPFVRQEWGEHAYAIMEQLKALVDPEGVLNPGVILSADPEAHLRHLKRSPRIEPEADRCIECGFCEPVCPSRDLTLTPRRRIVVRREMARLEASGEAPSALAELAADFTYDGLDTCATDGLCATACPVKIDTGALVKRLRASRVTPRGAGVARWIARHFGFAEGVARLGVRLAHLAEAMVGAPTIAALTRALERLLGRALPKWSRSVPRVPPRLPGRAPIAPELVYVPTCLSRLLGAPRDESPSLLALVVTLADRAGVSVRVPADTEGECCGLPFGSKGLTDAQRISLERLVDRLWAWSDGGRLPVALDASSCAASLLGASSLLSGEPLARLRALRVLDPVELAHDVLLPRLTLHPVAGKVVLHPTCSIRKAGLEGKLVAVARAAATEVIVPASLSCCATAGDRGLLFPELSASALADEAREVTAADATGHYSSNLTCEMGITEVSGRPYRSILYLLEEASRPTEPE